MAALPIRKIAGGVAVSLRVTPKASGSRIDGVVEDADGRAFVRLRVSEAPEKGKANEAVVRLLAKAWGLPKSTLEIASGETGRIKTIILRGDDLYDRLVRWFEEFRG